MRKFLLPVLIIAATAGACRKDKADAAEVNSITPDSEGPGASVTLAGRHFGDSASAKITFNGVAAKILTFSDTTAVVEVPAAATSGKVALSTAGGTVTVAENFVILKGRWTRRANYPGRARAEALGFSINGRGYYGGGYDGGGPLRDFYEYNPVTDQWTQKASLPNGRYRSASFVVNNKAYIATGISETGFDNQLWEYDPAADQWTRKKDFPGLARNDAKAITVNNKGYLGGGNTGVPVTALMDWWEYDAVADNWTKKADCPVSIRADAGIASRDGKIYSGMVFGNDLRWVEFNAGSNQWSVVSAFVGPETLLPAAFSIGNAGYVVSGTNQLCWRYNMLLNKWERATSIPVATIGGTGFSIGNKGYVAGGNWASQQSFTLNAFWEFDAQE